MNTTHSNSKTIWLIQLIAMITINLFIIVAFLTYSPADPGWAIVKKTTFIHNREGMLGAWVADFVYFYLGATALFIPMMLSYFNIKHLYRQPILRGLTYRKALLFCLGVLCIICSIAALLALFVSVSTFHLPAGPGGVLGQKISWFGLHWLHIWGTSLLLLSILAIGLVLINCDQIILVLKHGLIHLNQILKTHLPVSMFKSAAKPTKVSTKKAPSAKQVKETIDELVDQVTIAKSKPVTQRGPIATIVDRKTGYIKPHSSMLNQAVTQKTTQQDKIALGKIGKILETKLLDFNIQGEVVAVHPGPVVTRFEFQPAAGIRASKISSLSSDIARSLSKTSVRIVEVIAGKTTIGIEIPNTKRATVYLKEIIDSKVFNDSKSPLTIALGKDISGQATVADLAKMPHLLVAGTTGSGKSVGLNAMLLSLLYKATPDEIRLILIDPKMLELSVYEGIPHLLAPVITDMHEAGTALRWCVEEMERRYELMAAIGVRNLSSYNEKVINCRKEGSPLLNPLKVADNEAIEYLDTMPAIVVLADEYADMMMVVGKQVEQLIARIAQKARAAGIHLILATQRPSVDVITGLIKANIPSRIAFQVSSKIDSRTIIDQHGADQLLGYGDMLYQPPGTALPTRVHGAYVDDEEVHRVVAELSKNSKPKDMINLDKVKDIGANNGGGSGQSDQEDEMYQKAVEVVVSSKKASISYVQRRLKIGYNRAATLVELMEENGIISQPNNKGQREVLVE